MPGQSEEIGPVYGRVIVPSIVLTEMITSPSGVPSASYSVVRYTRPMIPPAPSSTQPRALRSVSLPEPPDPPPPVAMTPDDRTQDTHLTDKKKQYSSGVNNLCVVFCGESVVILTPSLITTTVTPPLTCISVGSVIVIHTSCISGEVMSRVAITSMLSYSLFDWVSYVERYYTTIYPVGQVSRSFARGFQQCMSCRRS